MDRPRTRYARSGELGIAFQVFGEGPLDVVMVPAWISNIEIAWELPYWSDFLGRLARFARVIVFDRRANGMSDGAAGAPLEEQMDDVRAVIDAAGAEQPVLFSMLEGCALSVLYAASYPEAVRALVMVTPVPRPVAGPGYEWAFSVEQRAAMVDNFVEHWGTDAAGNAFLDGLGVEDDLAAWRRWQRLGIGPAGARTSMEVLGETDVRDLLPSVQCPALVLHPEHDTRFDERHAQYVADHLSDVRFVRTPGSGPLWRGEHEVFASEIQHFLTGARPPVISDRVLATVLFTDIVGSTRRAAELGDGPWRELLERHDRVVREEVERQRGRFVKSLGDGALALFDGPSRAISSAAAIRDHVRALDLEIRAGLHTGECELLPGDDVGGLAVHIGARVSALAGPGEVLVSSTVRDLIVGSGQTLSDRGEHDLKGVPGPWRLYAVDG